MIKTKRTLAMAVALTAFLTAAVQMSSVQAAGKKNDTKVSAKAPKVKEVKAAKTKEVKATTAIKVNKAKTVSAEAAAVNALISTVPDVNKITLQDKAAVTAAYDAFKLLTKDQKVGLDKNYQGKITAAMNQIKRLEKAAARTLKLLNSGTETFDAFSAAGVTDVLETNKTAYDTALAAAKIVKGADLTLEEIQTVINTVNQNVIDTTVSTPVTDLITALDNTKVTFAQDVAAARAAYDSLTAAQKLLVINYSVLTADEQALLTPPAPVTVDPVPADTSATSIP